jgi:hypothetical protein
MNTYFSTQSNQPKPAREIALHVRAVEHQIAAHGAVSSADSVAQPVKALSGKLRLLLTLF